MVAHVTPCITYIQNPKRLQQLLAYETCPLDYPLERAPLLTWFN